MNIGVFPHPHDQEEQQNSKAGTDREDPFFVGKVCLFEKGRILSFGLLFRYIFFDIVEEDHERGIRSEQSQ